MRALTRQAAVDASGSPLRASTRWPVMGFVSPRVPAAAAAESHMNGVGAAKTVCPAGSAAVMFPARPAASLRPVARVASTSLLTAGSVAAALLCTISVSENPPCLSAVTRTSTPGQTPG